MHKRRLALSLHSNRVGTVLKQAHVRLLKETTRRVSKQSVCISNKVENSVPPLVPSNRLTADQTTCYDQISNTNTTSTVSIVNRKLPVVPRASGHTQRSVISNLSFKHNIGWRMFTFGCLGSSQKDKTEPHMIRIADHVFKPIQQPLPKCRRRLSQCIYNPCVSPRDRDRAVLTPSPSPDLHNEPLLHRPVRSESQDVFIRTRSPSPDGHSQNKLGRTASSESRTGFTRTRTRTRSPSPDVHNQNKLGRAASSESHDGFTRTRSSTPESGNRFSCHALNGNQNESTLTHSLNPGCHNRTRQRRGVTLDVKSGPTPGSLVSLDDPHGIPWGLTIKPFTDARYTRNVYSPDFWVGDARTGVSVLRRIETDFLRFGRDSKMMRPGIVSQLF
jgi:hypothetical protein